LHIAVYHNLSSGGAKRVVSEQVRRLAGAHVVTLLLPSTADRTFSEPGVPVPVKTFDFGPAPQLASPFGRVNPLMRLVTARRLDALGRAVAREAARCQADVMLVHPCQFTQSPAVLRYATMPTVYYCHEVARHAHEDGVVRKPSSRGPLRDVLDRLDPLHRLEPAG
jgi:hypothetical protein